MVPAKATFPKAGCKLSEADRTKARSPEAEIMVSWERLDEPRAKQPGHHKDNANAKERGCLTESFLHKAAGGG